MGCIFGVLANLSKVIQGSSGVEAKIAAEALEKYKLLVSFAISTLARQKPKLPHFVSQVMQTRGTKNLEYIRRNDNYMDKMGLLTFKDLEEAPSLLLQDGMMAEMAVRYLCPQRK